MNIFVYTGLSHAYLDPSDIDNFIGGASQRCAIKLGIELHKLGHNVTIAGDGLTSCKSNGVRYYNMYDVPPGQYDVAIVLRYPSYFTDIPVRAEKTILWLQDTTFNDGGLVKGVDGTKLAREHFDQIDYVVCLTAPHKKHFLELCPDFAHKTIFINNAIDDAFFFATTKVPGRFIWSSRPERGLDRALDIFSIIKKKLPHAEFVVASYQDLPKELLDKISATPGAVFKGKLKQSALHAEMCAAQAWLYPTNWFETSCVTAIEMQRAGVVCVCSDVGAIKETVGSRGVLFDPSISNEQIADLAITSLDANVVSGLKWASRQTWSNVALLWDALIKPQKTYRTNICLNMIVKNETAVLPRLFASVHRFVDSWVISDTGSTDGTPEFIENLATIYKVPGQLVHHTWENFGRNRQLALEAAVAFNAADFLLFIDADEEFQCSDDKFYEKLNVDHTYEIQKHHAETRYFLPALINIKKGRWRWHAPVHNYLAQESNLPSVALRTAWIKYHQHEGAKSHGLSPREKYLRDADILKRELEKNPKDSRSQFYLAQSYMDAGEHQKAIEEFKKVPEMDGWIEEQYVAYWKAGSLMLVAGQFAEGVGLLITAHELLPQRLEALFELVSWARINGRYHFGYSIGLGALKVANPRPFRLLTSPFIYEYAFADELSVCAYYVGDFELCKKLASQALTAPSLPPAEAERIKRNIELAKLKTS